MLSKLIGVALIIAGIAGLVLPIVPGILLIMAGLLIFSRNKAAIDWIHVKEELKARERIGLDDHAERGLAISKSLDESLAKAISLSKPNYIQTVKKINLIGEDFIEPPLR